MVFKDFVITDVIRFDFYIQFDILANF